MAGRLCIDAQLPDHKVDHLVDPLSPEGLEAVEEAISVEAGALLLAELAGHEVEDDLPVHLRAVVVVLHEEVSHLRAADCLHLSGHEGQGHKQEEKGWAGGNHFVC